MDTLQLKLFVSLSKTLNFSRTAEHFFISQPTVTHHIKALESILGVKLFNRTSRKLSLSDEGLEFLDYADKALEIIMTGETRLQNMIQGRIGHIRIAALSSTAHLLSKCLLSLYKKFPSIQVDVDLLEGSEQISAARDDKYDFCFSIRDMLFGAANYSSVTIAQERLELFVNTELAADIDITDFSSIEKYPFVSISRSDAWLTGRIGIICNNRGIKPNIINYYNRAEAVIISVNTGIGIAILPGELKRVFKQPNVVALPIAGDDAEVEYVFAWKHTQKTTACQYFKEIVLAAFAP